MIFLYILTCASANHSDNSTVTEPLEIDEKDFPIELFDPIAALKVANGIKGKQACLFLGSNYFWQR